MAEIYSPCRRVDGCGPPSYEPSRGYFTIRLWINGEMSVRRYSGGNLEQFDWCHHDNITFEHLNEWAVRVGCTGCVTYYWKHAYEHWNKVQLLDMDMDLRELVNQAAIDISVDIYVKHLKDDSDEEFIQFGRRIDDIRAKIDDWNEFVQSIDGSVGMYRRRAWSNSREKANPSCGKRLFLDESEDDSDHGSNRNPEKKPAMSDRREFGKEFIDDEDGLDSVNEKKEDGTTAGDDDDFIDEDYNIAADDEDYENVVKTCSTGRPPNVQIDPPSNLFEVPKVEYFDDSEYEDDDELFSGESSEDDTWVAKKKKKRDPEFNMERERYNPNFQVGMRFGSFKEFKEAAKNWGIKNRFQLYFPTNDKKRCNARCYSEKKSKKKCSFFIWASKVSTDDPTVQIKTLKIRHSCGMVFQNFHMTSEWLANKYIDRFRADPSWQEEGFVATVLADTGYKILPCKARRAKRKCLIKIYGEEHRQYAKLVRYGADVKQTNPGSTIKLWREWSHFKGYYVCLSPLKETFKKYLRPIVCVDGCWLKGTYGGQLLGAVGIDPNDCIFPIAWAVVKVENRETWTWFLRLLRDDLNIDENLGICFMSDRQKGLVGAIKDLFPNAEHRNCVRHMYTNFRSKFMGKELKDLVWNAARSTYPQQFERWLTKIEETNSEARQWFNHPDRPMQSWTRAFFRDDAKCDILLNNLCECFNAYILDTRNKPIVTMLDMIKNRVMKRLHTKRQMAIRWDQTICPKVAKKLEKSNMYSTLYIPTHNGHTRIRLDGGDGPHVCDLESKTCTCRRWQLTGLPCGHALCALRFNGDPFESYVDNHYTVDRYKKVYSIFINPTNNEDFWPPDISGVEVIPPTPVKPKRGRKPTKRRKEQEEIENEAAKKNAFAKKIASAASTYILSSAGVEQTKLSKKGKSTVTCSICGIKGHNKRHCPQKGQETGKAAANQGNGNVRVGEDNADDVFFDQLLDEGFGVVTQHE